MEPNRREPMNKIALPKKGLLPHRVVSIDTNEIGVSHPTVVSGQQPARTKTPLNIGTRGITPEGPSLETQVVAKTFGNEKNIDTTEAGFEEFVKKRIAKGDPKATFKNPDAVKRFFAKK